MTMRLIAWQALSIGLLACTEPKVEMAKRETLILGASQDAEGRVITTKPEQSLPDFPKTPPYQLYPAKYIIIPSVLPPQDAPFHFGTNGSQSKDFETVYVYEVAATPDYSRAKALPDLTTEAKLKAFNEAWADDFAKDKAAVSKLDELAKSFQWQSDSQMMDDQAVLLPPDLLENKPAHVKQTQRFLARRFNFKNTGMVTLQGQHLGKTYVIPFCVKSYSSSDIKDGEDLYKDPKFACQSCHGITTESEQGLYLKHSSDYLSSYTDEELLDIIERSQFPTGDIFLAGTHKYVLSSPTDQKALLAYLRSLPCTYEKTLELKNTHNFKVTFPGWP